MDTLPMHPRPEPPDADDLGPAHRLCLLLAGAAATLLGLACLLAPEAATQLLPWRQPPLHTRCLGAMHLAGGLTWLAAVRERDGAAVRIPLALLLTAALAFALLALRHRPAAAWLIVASLLGAAAFVLLRSLRELRAPAEHAQPVLALLALAAGAAAAALALWPGAMAAAWPWPLPATAAVQYAAWSASWAVALQLLARERRRAARRLALGGLLLLGAAVALASLLHLGSFHRPAGAGLWVGAFAAVALVALQRLSRRATWPAG